LKLKDAVKDYDEDSAEESEDEIDNATVDDSETWIPKSSSHVAFSRNATTIPKEAYYWSDDETDDMILGMGGDSSSEWSFERDFPTGNREQLLVNSLLAYGKKTAYTLVESQILSIQRQLLKGFDNIAKGISPYPFSKVDYRDVDWLTALEVTRDFVDSIENTNVIYATIKTQRYT
jgi:hypothetical protein